ncbi:amidohydrolase family protein [Bradyrhizobium canariense]|uniref:Aminocarboxymuconate-semialdehyde decarboxylase n=1 Tax=Bradyrhizobium canariense TaxID=255045 RepID=A0A1H2BUI4_9BRAD|nr:amidohydrolase family protein [Bradyrhizobium canariense]SDR79606.1 aminocarboxymuconate-semialdehyde decarboxylase [Bradyrhizobium canariense]SDT61732.1 aminocarboxymuconate-semialdehyde decarboxylase [Bradyrhizobium canariense]
MTTRRNFLKGAAATGIAFCSCGMLDAARAQPGTARLPVKVDGKRVRTIDVHAHCYFHEAIDLMGDEASKVLPPVKGVPEHFIVIEQRLKEMDAMAIDMEILSINPFWYGKDRDTVEAIVNLQNEKLAELCASRPDRFGAFASLALQFPDLAVHQLENAVKKQGLLGAAIGGSVAGTDFSDTKFHPVWAKAEELGAVLFIHPQSTPQLASRFKGNGWLSNTIGNPLDTTIALQHLIFEGTLDRFPGLKILAAHGGGYLGSYAERSDHACFVSPQNCDSNITLKKKPSEYLNQLYFDAMVFTPEGLRHLAAQVGASQIMLGTDHPIPWEQHPVDHVFATTSLTDKQKVAILGGNATRVFDLKET